MQFVLMLFLLGVPGGQTEAALFPTMEACEASRANLLGSIAQHNFSGEGNKILFFASVCLPLAKAPQGKAI